MSNQTTQQSDDEESEGRIMDAAVRVGEVGQGTADAVTGALGNIRSSIVQGGVAVRRTLSDTVDSAKGAASRALSRVGSVIERFDGLDVDNVEEYENGYRIRVEGDISKHMERITEELDIEDDYELRVTATAGSDERPDALIIDLIEKGDDGLRALPATVDQPADGDLIDVDIS